MDTIVVPNLQVFNSQWMHLSFQKSEIEWLLEMSYLQPICLGIGRCGINPIAYGLKGCMLTMLFSLCGAETLRATSNRCHFVRSIEGRIP